TTHYHPNYRAQTAAILHSTCLILVIRGPAAILTKFDEFDCALKLLALVSFLWSYICLLSLFVRPHSPRSLAARCSVKQCSRIASLSPLTKRSLERVWRNRCTSAAIRTLRLRWKNSAISSARPVPASPRLSIS